MVLWYSSPKVPHEVCGINLPYIFQCAWPERCCRDPVAAMDRMDQLEAKVVFLTQTQQGAAKTRLEKTNTSSPMPRGLIVCHRCRKEGHLAPRMCGTPTPARAEQTGKQESLSVADQFAEAFWKLKQSLPRQQSLSSLTSPKLVSWIRMPVMTELVRSSHRKMMVERRLSRMP